MRTIYFYICFVVNLIWAGIKVIKLIYMKKYKTKEEEETYVAKVANDWSTFILKVAGLNLTVIGKENIPNEPCVFVGNHQSNLDIPVIISVTRKT